MAGYYDEKRRDLSATNEEMDAWEALRREPGLMGRLARRGKRMKPSYTVGGRRKFDKEERSEKEKAESQTTGERVSEQVGVAGRNLAAAVGGGRRSGMDYQSTGTAAERQAAGITDQQRRSREQEARRGGSGGGPSGPSEAQIREKIAAEEKSKKEAKYSKETEERKVRRGELTDEFGGYKDEYGELKDEADYSGTREDLAGYQEQADTLAGEVGTKYGEYESQIGKMPDRGAEVAGYGEDVAGYGRDVAGMREDVGGDVTTGKAGMEGAREEIKGAAGEFKGMAAQAQDTGALMKDRGLFAGQMEAQRKAGQKGKLAKLRRSMAAAGSSPEEIARAEAEASGGAQAGREDALAASMASMQSGRQGLSQAGQFTQQGIGAQGMQAQLAGQQAALGLQGTGMRGQLTGQAAGMAGQAAALAGQAQGLNLQKTQAQMGAYGAGIGAQQNLMTTGAGLAQAQQASLQGQIAQQAGLTGQQAGMTEAQLQDVVAQQNAAQQADLAERGLTATAQANAANAPRAPSQMDQMLGMAQTVAPIAMMAMSDKKAKKNVRSAKDKDLMGPKEIDGFLNDLYAYQYNYKDAGHGTGKQVGVMAQDLEKTQLGKQMVENTPQGKQINAAKGLGLAMASQARINQRLNSIGA